MRPLLLVMVASLFACGGGNAPGSGATMGGGGSGGNSASSASASGGAASNNASSSGSGCTYPPVSNPAGCPAAYSTTFNGQPCSMPGLQCWYPGVGDTGADGCNATALLECTTQFSDGGAAEWRAAQ